MTASTALFRLGVCFGFSLCRKVLILTSCFQHPVFNIGSGNSDQFVACWGSKLTTRLVKSIFVMCYVDRVGYLMILNIAYHFINDSALQCIDFPGISYGIWKNGFYTIWIILLFTLHWMNVCFNFHLQCSVVFLRSFLNTKKINADIIIHEISSINIW